MNRRSFVAMLGAIVAFPMKAFTEPQSQTFRHTWTAGELTGVHFVVTITSSGGYMSINDWRRKIAIKGPTVDG